jgi:hypothetical protein
MISEGISTSPPAESPGSSRFSRLRLTATLLGDAHERWMRSRLGIVGCGNLGSRIALEAVRSGASICAIDPDVGSEENLGTQIVEAGSSKAESIARACEALAPGKAVALPLDVRHVGIGTLRELDLILDATDDPDLAGPLTMISNGLGIPLLRVALDGTGETESGRVLASHGGGGHACQLCSYSPLDLAEGFARTPCPGGAAAGPPPTLAGGAIGMAVAGLGLISAQRLLGGNGADLVLDREVLIDLGGREIHVFGLGRSERCLSGHETWAPLPLRRSAAETTLDDLFEAARRELGSSTDPTIEPFLHPICLAAACACGEGVAAVGTPWAAAPACRRCGGAMRWIEDIRWPRLRREQAAALGILDVSLTRLGLPSDGALVSAFAEGRPRVRFLLDVPADGPRRTEPSIPLSVR